MNGLTEWTRIISIITITCALFMTGCSSGKRGRMPAILDYEGPNAEIHADNVRNFWERTKLKYQEDKENGQSID